MAALPRRYTAPAAFRALPFNLLSVVDWIADPDTHYGMGMQWQPLCPGGGSTFDGCIVSGGGSPPAKASNASLGLRGSTPFTVFTEVDCSTPGWWDRAEELAATALSQVEAYVVEQIFWTGTVAGIVNVAMPHLAANAIVTEASQSTGPTTTLQTAATVVTGSVLDVVEGLGLLEQGLADCYKGGTGVIHVTQALFDHLATNHLIVKDGPVWRTPNGNMIVPGGGYAGTSPAGVATVGTSWMYATGPVFGWRGPLQILGDRAQRLDRNVNTVKTIVERTYTLGFDCCHLAVQVSTGGIITGTPGTPT